MRQRLQIGTKMLSYVEISYCIGHEKGEKNARELLDIRQILIEYGERDGEH